MDPVTILSIAAAAMEIGFKSFEAGQALGNFISDTKSIDQTLAAMASEIKALGGACNMIGTRVKSIAEAIDQSDTEKGKESPLWQQVQSQLDDCSETVNALSDALDGVSKEKKKNPFAQAWRQIQLNMRAKDIDEARNRIRSHTASLQLVLQAITLEVSYLAPHKADQQLVLLLESIRDIKEELSHMRHSSSDPEISDTERRHDQKEEQLIQYTDRIISSGETLYEQSVAGGSVIGPSEGLDEKITSWVSRLQALSTDDVETDPEEFGHGSSVSGADQATATDITSDSGLDRASSMSGDDLDIDGEDEEDDLQVEMIKEAYSLGVAEFEKKDYDKANELLQEVLTMVEESPMRSSKMVDVRQLRWMLAVCAYHTNDFQTAEVALKEIVQIPPQSQEDRIRLCDAGHILALVSLRQDKLNEARQYCDSALQGRRRLLGKQDPACYESLALLARIFELQDNSARAGIYSKMIPESQRETLLAEYKKFGNQTHAKAKEALVTEKELPPLPPGPPPYVPGQQNETSSAATTPSTELPPEQRWKFRPPVPTQAPPEIAQQVLSADDEPPVFPEDTASGNDMRAIERSQTWTSNAVTRPPVPRSQTSTLPNNTAEQYKEILALKDELAQAKKKNSKKSTPVQNALKAYASAVHDFDLQDTEAQSLHEDVLAQAKGTTDESNPVVYKTYANLGKIAESKGDHNTASDMYQKVLNGMKKNPAENAALKTAVQSQLADSLMTTKKPEQAYSVLREELKARRRLHHDSRLKAVETADCIRRLKEARREEKRAQKKSSSTDNLPSAPAAYG